MPVRITCATCKACFTVDDSLRGKSIKCRGCEKALNIPPRKAAKPDQQAADGSRPPSTSVAAAPPRKLSPTADVPDKKNRPEAGDSKTKPVSVKAVLVVAQSVPEPAEKVGKRRRGSAKISKSGSGVPLMWLIGGGIAALGVLGLAAVGVVAYLVFKTDPSQDSAQANNSAKPSKAAPVDGQQIDRKQAQGGGAKSERNNGPKLEDPLAKGLIQQKLADSRPPPPLGGGQLDPAVLTKVKRATVQIRVVLSGNRGVSQGSGFFAISPGLVLTNAHVLGMLNADSPAPQSLIITYQSGEPDSRRFSAKILGVDRSSDLALLRVVDQNLPEPLVVKPASELIETQTVYIVGFPFGDSLGKNITVSQSSVSSLRKLPTGEVHQVQVNGGMHPGNSGGPVVNTSGEVVGVAVSVIEATQINFAVPGEYVYTVLNGRVAGVSTGLAQRVGTNGSELKMPVNLDVLDPLGRVQKVACQWWTAKPGPQRPPANSQPVLQPGDSPHRELVVTYNAGRGQAELVFPAKLEPGHVIWLQPMIVNGLGKAAWTNSITVIPAMPIDREPGLLALKHFWGARPLVLTTHLTLKASEGAKNDSITINTQAAITETMTTQKPGVAELRLRYLSYPIPVLPGTMDSKELAKLKMLESAVPSIHANLIVDDKNNLKKNEIDLSKSPKDLSDELIKLHKQSQQSLDTLSIPLPGRTMQPDEQWKDKRPLTLFAKDTGAVPMVDVTYTFLGVRHQGIRNEGVISLSGKVIDQSGKATVTGTLTGTASFDLDVCQFSSVNVEAKVIIADNKGSKATVSLATKMDRLLGKEILNVRGQLTNQDQLDAKQCRIKIHEVKLEAARPCTISLESFKGPGNFDTFLRLEDSTGKELASDDDHGVDLNSLVVFTPKQAGTYRVVATSFEPAVGNYLLVVRQ